MYNSIGERYPYRINPQYTDSQNSVTELNLRCPNQGDAQFIVINNNNLSVVHGWNLDATFELQNFFVPVSSYQETAFVLTKHSGSDYSTVSLSIGTSNATFICILPEYINMSIDDQSLWRLKWRFTGSSVWNEMGRILILDYPKDISLSNIELRNEMSEEVGIKILLAK